jgi:negative regulator of flagellin synthesis FlgM
MKITHNKVGTNLNTSDTAKADGADKAKARNGGDTKQASLFGSDLGATKVDLSPRAQDMKKIRDVAMSAPDVDEAKVARLQKMVDEQLSWE